MAGKLLHDVAAIFVLTGKHVQTKFKAYLFNALRLSLSYSFKYNST